MNRRLWSYYDWLDMHFENFVEGFFPRILWGGIVAAHADKCLQYKDEWEEHGVPFLHGCMIYLLSYLNPWAKEVRDTPDGFIDPKDWVIYNYDRFKKYLHTQDFEKVEPLYRTCNK